MKYENNVNFVLEHTIRTAVLGVPYNTTESSSR